MNATVTRSTHYCAAIAVGVCFGLLLGGALVFMLYSEPSAPVLDWSKTTNQPATQPATPATPATPR